MIGSTIARLVPAEIQDQDSVLLKTVLRGVRIKAYETQRVNKKGERIDVSVTISPICAPSGQIIGTSKVVRDITERKASLDKINALLKEKELLLREVLFHR